MRHAPKECKNCAGYNPKSRGLLGVTAISDGLESTQNFEI